jgi:hypothetical protein
MLQIVQVNPGLDIDFPVGPLLPWNCAERPTARTGIVRRIEKIRKK